MWLIIAWRKWGEPWRRGWRGRKRCNERTGLSGGASFALGVAHWATPTHCSASCTDCAKVSTGKGGAKEVDSLEANRALKRVSADIKVADGAGIPWVRMVADGARVRMDIATEQCQDKETSKGGLVNKKRRSRPVMTGQLAAQRENSPRQWGDLSVAPLGRSVLPFRPIPIGEGTAPPRWGGRMLVLFFCDPMPSPPSYCQSTLFPIPQLKTSHLPLPSELPSPRSLFGGTLLSRSIRSELSRLRCHGHSLLLSSYLHRISRKENSGCSACGHPLQDLNHLLLDCPAS